MERSSIRELKLFSKRRAASGILEHGSPERAVPALPGRNCPVVFCPREPLSQSVERFRAEWIAGYDAELDEMSFVLGGRDGDLSGFCLIQVQPETTVGRGIAVSRAWASSALWTSESFCRVGMVS